MPFEFIPGPLKGIVIIRPGVFPDERGFFFESYKHSEFCKAGITETFVQDNHSRSNRAVLRGLHYQNSPHAQGKLVRVVRGAVWDVAVDIRPDSETYLEWFGIELSEENRTMFYVPAGFAHGFLTLKDDTEFLYKCTAEYHKASEAGIRYNDPKLAIKWPDLGTAALVSTKDDVLPRLDQGKE